MRRRYLRELRRYRRVTARSAERVAVVHVVLLVGAEAAAVVHVAARFGAAAVVHVAARAGALHDRADMREQRVDLRFRAADGPAVQGQTVRRHRHQGVGALAVGQGITKSQFARAAAAQILRAAYLRAAESDFERGRPVRDVHIHRLVEGERHLDALARRPTPVGARTAHLRRPVHLRRVLVRYDLLRGTRLRHAQRQSDLEPIAPSKPGARPGVVTISHMRRIGEGELLAVDVQHQVRLLRRRQVRVWVGLADQMEHQALRQHAQQVLNTIAWIVEKHLIADLVAVGAEIDRLTLPGQGAGVVGPEPAKGDRIGPNLVEAHRQRLLPDPAAIGESGHLIHVDGHGVGVLAVQRAIAHLEGEARIVRAVGVRRRDVLEIAGVKLGLRHRLRYAADRHIVQLQLTVRR